jgi:ribonuclease VapC
VIFADASAIVAVLLGESEAAILSNRFRAEVGSVYVSPMVRLEVVFALAKGFARQGGPRSVQPSDLVRADEAYAWFVERVQATEIPIDAEIGHRALEAARTYGKLVHHPAQLNLGDCFAHACAKSLGASLLYKGEDFARTDLA